MPDSPETELSRRQLRHLEQSSSSAEPLTRKQLREQERAALDAEIPPDEYLTPTGPIGLIPEPKSLVVDMVRDVTNSVITVADSGVSVVTGSITLPTLPVAGTGEIKTVEIGAVADEAAFQERFEAETTGISPIAAPLRRGSRRRRRVFTTNLRAGQSQLYWVIGSLIGMLVMAGLFIFGLLTGLVK